MNSNFTTTNFIRNVSIISENYGFKNRSEYEKIRELYVEEPVINEFITDNLNFEYEEKLVKDGINFFYTNKLNYLEKPIFTYCLDKNIGTNELVVAYHIYNVSSSIAEAMLIQCLCSIIKDLGDSQYYLRINSLGDKESKAKFKKELLNYFKKKIDILPPTARELMKHSVEKTFLYLVENKHELIYGAPNPLEYLSDASRKHFRDIIEFLEMSGISYEIDSNMIDTSCYSEVLFKFEIEEYYKNRNYPHVVITGGRIEACEDDLSNENSSIVSATLVLKDRKAPNKFAKPRYKTPCIYLAHLGFGPKVRTLLLLEELRCAGINVYHNVAYDSVTRQLREAEKKKCSYIVIIGQKEYVEGSVILRDTKIENQETISQKKLLSKLKRLNKKK